ncbi:MAG: methyltransferase domain-containing protein [Hyphomicrobiales bacterium]|nr:methyltransferase domain-containing protein [Hyphomicrobiales bacterium]
MTAANADARFWDRIARKYARDPIKDMVGYERTIERTGALLGTGDTVLEIGCGTGTTALRLAPRVARILATDVSSEMITIAREKAVQAGCGNVEFAVATAAEPTWLDASFDAVLAFNVLHLVPQRRDALARVLRVLKPGGLFISKTACLAEMSVLIRMAVPLMRAVGKAPYVEVFSGAELEREISAAGFAVEECTRHGSTRRDPRVFIVARKPRG